MGNPHFGESRRRATQQNYFVTGMPADRRASAPGAQPDRSGAGEVGAAADRLHAIEAMTGMPFGRNLDHQSVAILVPAAEEARVHATIRCSADVPPVMPLHDHSIEGDAGAQLRLSLP